MKLLFFDCSAAGKPIKWNLPHTDTFNWPRLIHIAWLIMNDQKQMIEEGNFIIKPDGFEISPEAEQKHGITHEDAKEQGESLRTVLQGFSDAVDQADMIIAHNLQFNENVVAAEFLRLAMDHRLFQSERICLMREATYFCKLPGRGQKYKWPSLQEIYMTLFRKKYKYAGNAYIDVKVAAACFFALKDMGELEDLFD